MIHTVQKYCKSTLFV